MMTILILVVCSLVAALIIFLIRDYVIYEKPEGCICTGNWLVFNVNDKCPIHKHWLEDDALGSKVAQKTE